jgi:hypothetical protein
MHPYVHSAVIVPAVVGMVLATRCDAFGQTKLGTRTNPGTSLGIVRKPAPSLPMHGLWTFRLPVPDPKSSNPAFQVDLRGRNLSRFDLRSQRGTLALADFDTQTVWPAPERMPEGFDPGRRMELGKNPGLGVRRLHERGITGKGVGVAVIDQTLLVDHDEYRDRLRLYEEIHSPETHALMHGPAVASIAVGKTVGVAPGADLYYIAGLNSESITNSAGWDLAPLARSIDRVLEINASLPADRKIRVISISLGWGPVLNGHELVTEAARRAKAQEVFVACVALDLRYPDHPSFLLGLGRDPDADPDATASYDLARWETMALNEPGSRYAQVLKRRASRGTLLAPIDSRCTASPTGPHDYVFYRSGGMSWAAPYLAGLYALACQVKPTITPEEFIDITHRTGDPFKWASSDLADIPARVVNPVGLIEALGARFQPVISR